MIVLAGKSWKTLSMQAEDLQTMALLITVAVAEATWPCHRLSILHTQIYYKLELSFLADRTANLGNKTLPKHSGDMEWVSVDM